MLPPAHETVRLTIDHPTTVAEARRSAAGMAEALGFDETERGKIALVVTELASNVVYHAQAGELLLRALRSSHGRGLEILSLDKGPGMRDVAQCMRDGYSSRGTAGHGLGSVSRLSSVFDVYSRPDRGSAVLAQLWVHPQDRLASPLIVAGAVCLAKTGETVCGDAWAAQLTEHCARVLVVDGLGHGQGAADASHAALDCFGRHERLQPTETLEYLHAALRSTRGASGSVAELDLDTHVLRFAGVGNCPGTIYGGPKQCGLPPHNGTLGMNVANLRSFSYAWPEAAVLIIHSDGLTTRWQLDDYPGLSLRHPSVVAGVLYRDFWRGHDDATVVAVRAVTGVPAWSVEGRA